MDSIVVPFLILAAAAMAAGLTAAVKAHRSGAELRRRNRDLDAALEHMSLGVNMLDADCRLVLANARYLQMYGLARASVRPARNSSRASSSSWCSRRSARGTQTRPP